MGREIRRVPKNWEHPIGSDGRQYKALWDGNYDEELADYQKHLNQWNKGFTDDYEGGWKPIEDRHRNMTFSDWHGGRPYKEDYMPKWSDEEKTHIVMYETCTEGTPISPAFDNPQDLAQWLFDNGASSFGSRTATYEQWLGVCKGGYAPSAVVIGGELKSGVEAI